MSDNRGGPRTLSQRVASVLALFTSMGTLICYALPVALATLAGGSAVFALTSAVPWLIPLSRQKNWIFPAAALLLAVNGILVFRPKGKVACAVTGGNGCKAAGRFSKAVFFISAAILAVGVFFAYLLVPLSRFSEGG